MRIDITKQEARWLADLVKRDKLENTKLNETTPHPLYELRRDNMESLEYKLESAIQRQMNKENAR